MGGVWQGEGWESGKHTRRDGIGAILGITNQGVVAWPKESKQFMATWRS